MGGGGGLEKKEKKKLEKCQRKTKGVVSGGSKGKLSCSARKSFSDFWCVGSVFQFFGSSEVSSTKTFVFFWKFENSFYFFDSKDSSQPPFFWCFCQKNRVMQKGGPKKREKVLLEKRKEKEKNQRGTWRGEKRADDVENNNTQRP